MSKLSHAMNKFVKKLKGDDKDALTIVSDELDTLAKSMGQFVMGVDEIHDFADNKKSPEDDEEEFEDSRTKIQNAEKSCRKFSGHLGRFTDDMEHAHKECIKIEEKLQPLGNLATDVLSEIAFFNKSHGSALLTAKATSGLASDAAKACEFTYNYAEEYVADPENKRHDFDEYVKNAHNYLDKLQKRLTRIVKVYEHLKHDLKTFKKAKKVFLKVIKEHAKEIEAGVPPKDWTSKEKLLERYYAAHPEEKKMEEQLEAMERVS